MPHRRPDDGRSGRPTRRGRSAGRIGDSKCIPTILETLANDKNDRVLDHSLTYALIEIGDAKAVREGLRHSSALFAGRRWQRWTRCRGLI